MFDAMRMEFDYLAASLGYRFNRSGARKKLLVNGSPKTGTTWMVRLLSSIPSYREIGNFKADIERYATVMEGNVVHGHDWPRPRLQTLLEENGVQVVLMVRDPRDQTVSRMFHILRAESHPWHAYLAALSIDDALLATIEGREEAGKPNMPGSAAWLKFTHEWHSAGWADVHVKYETLLADTEAELIRVTDALGMRLGRDLISAMVERNQFGRLAAGKRFWKTTRKPGQEDRKSHFRKGISGDWRNYFKPQHNERFKELAGDSLITLAYESDLNW